MSRKKFKRLTALALCVAMCLTAAPVYAEEDSGTAQPETHQEIVTEEMEGQDGQQAQNGDVSENGESQSGQTGEAQDTEQGTTGDQTGTTQPEETVPEETAPEESAPEQPDNGLELLAIPSGWSLSRSGWRISRMKEMWNTIPMYRGRAGRKYGRKMVI